MPKSGRGKLNLNWSGVIFFWYSGITGHFTSPIVVAILGGVREETFVTDKTPAEIAPIPATRLEHVALAVPDLDAAINFYSGIFGLKVSETVVSVSYTHLTLPTIYSV